MSDTSGKGSAAGPPPRDKPADLDEDLTRRDSPAHDGRAYNRAHDGAYDRSSDSTRRDTGAPEDDGPTDGTRFDTRRKSDGAGTAADGGAGGWNQVPAAVTERYEVVRALPTGGEAYRVLLTRDKADGSLWVVKLYHGSARRNDDVMRGLREADHPNVVRLRDFGAEPDPYGGAEWPWEVMEYVPDGSLAELLHEGGALPERQVRSVLEQLSAGLHYLHTELRIGEHRGAAHRDVKPANVLLRSARDPVEAVLADFGLVAEARHTRQTDVAAGSASYQAPETFLRADRRPTQDWWSLGVVVAEMLTGENPNAAGSGGWSSTRALQEILITHDVDLSAVADARWLLLCEGLLTRELEHRWGYEQVSTWLRGGSPPVRRKAPDPHAGRPLRLGGQGHHRLEELAEAMVAGPSWQDARDLFLSAERLAALRTWLDQEFDGGGIPADLVGTPAQDARAAAVRIAAFRAAVLTDAPPVFAGHPADAPGLCALAASSATQDQQVAALISGDLLRVFAYHPCATPAVRGHGRCGSRCEVLAEAAEALPIAEDRLRQTISGLRAQFGHEASAALRDALATLQNNRELRVLCLRSVLDPASVRRERLRLMVRRRTSRLRACRWWMRLSADALRERDAPARLLLARVLMSFAAAEGLEELTKPGGRNKKRRERARDAADRTTSAVLAVSADLATAAVLLLTSLTVLYVSTVAWLQWAGEEPDPRVDRYAQVAAAVQYTLAVPLTVALLSVVLLHRPPVRAAVLAVWLVLVAGAAVALTLWNDLGSRIRFPYVPGTDFRQSLLETDRLAGDHPGAAACWAAVGATIALVAVVKANGYRATRGGLGVDAGWVRGLVIVAVVILLVFPALAWWVPPFVPTEPKELW